MFDYHRLAQYYETDGMGIIHHANYIHWMEEARIAWMDDFGYGYERLTELGIGSPLTSLEVKYLHPCRFKDNVLVRVRLLAYDGVHIDIGYEMRVGDTVVFTGSSRHVLTSLETGMVLRTRRACPELDAALKRICGEDTAS